MRVLTYRGINKRGVHVMGSVQVESAAEFAQRKYEAGWTELDAYDGDTEVAGIGPHADTGNRSWWGEV